MPGPTTRASRSLFAKVLVTFLLTMLGATLLSGLIAFQLGRTYGPPWVDKVVSEFEVSRETLEQATDPVDLEAAAAAFGRAVNATVHIDARPRRFFRRSERLHVGAMRRLRRGEPVVVPPAGPTKFLKILIPLFSHGSEKLSAIIVVRPPAPRLTLLLAGSIGGLLVIVAGSWLFSRSLTRRVIGLERAAKALAAGDLSARARPGSLAATTRGDELDLLAATFDEMADRIDQLVRGQKALLTNVSHELRTPIARIRVLLEMIQDRVPERNTPAAIQADMSRLAEDVDEVEGLIRDLLTSGRLELGADASAAFKPVDLRPLCEQLAERFDAAIDFDAVTLTVMGDAMLLERAISNLLSNARRACREGDVTLRGRVVERRIRLTISDRGRGIEPEQRERIFEAFVRLDSARSRDAGGAGLGLYLTRKIVDAHGGHIHARGRDDGQSGACFEIDLPAAESAPSGGAV